MREVFNKETHSLIDRKLKNDSLGEIPDYILCLCCYYPPDVNRGDNFFNGDFLYDEVQFFFFGQSGTC